LVGRNICVGTGGSGIRAVGGSRGGGGRAVGGKWDPFLLLLYVRHCKRSAAEWYGHGSSGAGAEGEQRGRNSGVGRGMVESLSVFRFGALHGQKEGPVCAVCLGWFDGIDTTAPRQEWSDVKTVVRRMLKLTLEWNIMVKKERKLEMENWSSFLEQVICKPLRIGSV
jgi:hypothetical protein